MLGIISLVLHALLAQAAPATFYASAPIVDVRLVCLLSAGIGWHCLAQILYVQAPPKRPLPQVVAELAVLERSREALEVLAPMAV